MNYLAHLYLAQPNADSHFGNLLGDFGGNQHKNKVKLSVQLGLANHYLVDKFTDNHELVKQAKSLFSPHRKRFAAIAVDVLFDHFLIKHWQTFGSGSFEGFKKQSYHYLALRTQVMPEHMALVVNRMISSDWFSHYQSTAGLATTLDNIAKRIRFSNNFAGAIEDIDKHYQQLDGLFLAFFPELIKHVNLHAIESEKNNRT